MAEHQQNLLLEFWTTVDRSNQSLYISEVETFLSQPPIQTIFDQIEAVDDTTGLDTQALVPYSPIGYVYAAWNPLFKDLIKIGATKRDHPYARVLELSGTSVPEPFQLVAAIPCQHPFVLERAIHSYFHSVRKYGRRKEFFLVSREEIVEHFHLRSVCHFMVTENVEFKAKVHACFGGENKGQKKRKAPSASKHDSEKSGRKKKKAFPASKTDGGIKQKRGSVNGGKSFAGKQGKKGTFSAVSLQAVSNFVRDYIVTTESEAFLTTHSVKDRFKESGFELNSDDVFSKQLRAVIASRFPRATYKKTRMGRGYHGIMLKD